MTATTHHHLTAHWVDEDEGLVGIHTHLMEVWEDEDEAPVTAPKSVDSATKAVS
jgi:hypothetical protein